MAARWPVRGVRHELGVIETMAWGWVPIPHTVRPTHSRYTGAAQWLHTLDNWFLFGLCGPILIHPSIARNQGTQKWILRANERSFWSKYWPSFISRLAARPQRFCQSRRRDPDRKRNLPRNVSEAHARRGHRGWWHGDRWAEKEIVRARRNI